MRNCILIRRFAMAWLTSTLAVGAGCSNISNKASAVFFPARADSWHTKGEVVTIDLSYKETPTREEILASRPTLKGEATDAQLGQAGGAYAAAAKVVIDQIAEFLEKEAERYTATYSAVAIDDTFFSGWRKASPVHLDGIELVRKVVVDGKRKTAAKIKFDVRGTMDGTAFTIKPTAARVDLAKAKVPSFEWLDPGSWFNGKDDDVDLTVQLTMHAVWIDDRDESHSAKVYEGKLKISDLTLGKQYGVENAESKESVGENNEPMPGGEFAGQLVPSIPRSHLGRDEREVPTFGTGNFVVSILVTEHDDYGGKVREAGTSLSENRDKIVGYIAKDE